MTTEDKALAIANTLLATDRVTLGQLSHKELMMTLVYVVEQHEAFRQEVSDIVEGFLGEGVLTAGFLNWANNRLAGFIIPAPKPDPLVEVLHGEDWQSVFEDEVSDKFRATLDKFGLEIREKNDG